MWKFGIAYQKCDNPKKSKINSLPLTTHYRVYKIKFGDKTLPFQQVEVLSNSSLLDFIGGFSSCSTCWFPIESLCKKWLSSFVFSLFNNINNVIEFMPTEALFEVVYFYADSFDLTNEEITLDDFSNYLFMMKIKMSSEEFNVISKVVRVLKKRKIDKMIRVFEKYSNSNAFHQNNLLVEKRNNDKLFRNIGSYYNEFCINLFGHELNSRFLLKGKYCINILIELCEYNIINKQCIYSYTPSDNFVVEICDLNKTNQGNVMGLESLNTNFVKHGYNIAYMIINILYKKICTYFGLKIEKLFFDSNGNFF